jgi:hypothetical protein
MNNKSLEDIAFEKAAFMIEHGLIQGMGQELDIFEVTDLLIKLEQEKIYKNLKNDETIDFNDEIISIEEVGILDTIDISVSGDNLFYCNGILTKNSFGIPAIADFMLAIINSEELYELNQIMIKQLKNRYRDLNLNKRFVIGVDRAKMRLYDVEDSAQEGIVDAGESRQEESYTKTFGKNKLEKKSFDGFKV